MGRLGAYRLPLVEVQVEYRVGSRNEEPGKTGLAHLLEHALFYSSTHMDGLSVSYHLHRIGALRWNAATGKDETTFYELIPSANLENALWVESERLGFLIDQLRGHDFEAERQIVKNERRERIDMQPYAACREQTRRALFPSAHPCPSVLRK